MENLLAVAKLIGFVIRKKVLKL